MMKKMTEPVMICRRKKKKKEIKRERERKESAGYEQRKCLCYSQWVKNGNDTAKNLCEKK